MPPCVGSELRILCILLLTQLRFGEAMGRVNPNLHFRPYFLWFHSAFDSRYSFDFSKGSH